MESIIHSYSVAVNIKVIVFESGIVYTFIYRYNKKTRGPWMQKIVYIDMDNVLVDFQSAFEKIDAKTLKEYEGHLDDIPGIFALMVPMEGAVEAFQALSESFDVYILSTAPWNNHSAWTDKVLWVKKYLGDAAHKRLIISHHKNLNRGDYLIDDRTKNGADKFEGELIQFGSEAFENWGAVLRYLIA
jgi:5'-nucleotidase